jgi:hypothetical protein
MLALAIEFSRCSKARTLKAEQCVLMMIPRAGNPFAIATTRRCGSGGCQKSSQCIDLESCRVLLSPFRLMELDSPKCQRLLRKEVIQPHLPVRLPCYDFTPIASPTFDGSLHKG